jgi:carbamoyl-phosphate synthase large subunit
MVDTCAAEFEARTPYLYSTYEEEDESNPKDVKKVVVIGSGPIRIGQGIEFDYCCVHSSMALEEEGVDSIMINNNPETVSTDYDTSSKLYFEPLTFEDVMNVMEREKPEGVIVQFGGQTSVNLALPLHRAGVRILGTHPLMMEEVEDREKFTEILNRLDIPQAPYGTARTEEEAFHVVRRIGYPVLVRPSFVLGGRAMEVVNNDRDLKVYLKEAFSVSSEYPILVDKYLENAVELDVDALCDGDEVFVAAIMEHIEEAGVHSGDSACVIPPQSITPEVKKRIVEYVVRLSKELKVLGLINIQCALSGDTVYFLEANPRASRTVPFVSKTIGKPLAKIATKLMLGKKLSDFDLHGYSEPEFISIKESVFPFIKFPGVDPALAPEMRSTGEVMGIDRDFGQAYFKAQEAAYGRLPLKGTVIIHTQVRDKGSALLSLTDVLVNAGFKIAFTRPTYKLLKSHGLSADMGEIMDDEALIDLAEKKGAAMIICLPDVRDFHDPYRPLRRTAVDFHIPLFTTLRGAESAVRAIVSCMNREPSVGSIQSYHA